MIMKINGQKGFSLIEMIAVLVLVGIMAAVAGMGIVQGIQGYLFAKSNASLSEKANMAIARINRELLECYNCSGTAGSSVLYPVNIINPLGRRSFLLEDGSVKIMEIAESGSSTTDVLIDNVNSFSMTYDADGSITVNMNVTSPYSTTPIAFSTNVHPRNTN